MKIKIILMTMATIMPMMAAAGPCDTLWPEHNCQQWDELERDPERTCVCNQCPTGTMPFPTDKIKNLSNKTYYLDRGCGIICDCANNPDTSMRGGSCDPLPADITKPDYSSCGSTPTGAKLCNDTTNPCKGRYLTIGNQKYCEFTGSSCNNPVMTSSMLVSKYCLNGAGNPAGGLSCKGLGCKGNATMNATYDQCLCNKGYYRDSQTATCQQCPELDDTLGTTTAAGGMAVTECFIPAKTDITDKTGTYQFNEKCNY